MAKKDKYLDKFDDNPIGMIDPAPPIGPIGHLTDWLIKKIFKGK